MPDRSDKQGKYDCPYNEDLIEMKVKLEFIEKHQEKYDEILETVLQAQTSLGNKLMELDYKQRKDSSTLESMSNNDKLQNKLLMGIFTALIGICAAIVSKFLIGGH